MNKAGEEELCKTLSLLTAAKSEPDRPSEQQQRSGLHHPLTWSAAANHKQVSISNHLVDVVLNHDLGFTSSAATGTGGRGRYAYFSVLGKEVEKSGFPTSTTHARNGAKDRRQLRF